MGTRSIWSYKVGDSRITAGSGHTHRVHSIDWSHGHAEVVKTAAMVRRFDALIDGRRVPALAPPLDPTDPRGLPGHLRVLGGEFTCLPFGSAPGPSIPTAGWERFAKIPEPEPQHGHSAEKDWELVDRGPGWVSLHLRYPEDSLIAAVERVIAGCPGQPTLTSTTTMHPRHSGRIAAGMHPILPLPSTPGALHLSADFVEGFTYPARIGDGQPSRPGIRFIALHSVPARDGGSVDFSRLPLPDPTDDVLLLAGVRSPLVAEDIERGIRTTVAWRGAALTCSNCGSPIAQNPLHRGIPATADSASSPSLRHSISRMRFRPRQTRSTSAATGHTSMSRRASP